jgi:hypothetical protein
MLVLFVCFSVFLCVFVCCSSLQGTFKGRSLSWEMGPTWPSRRMQGLRTAAVISSSTVAEPMADETAEGRADAKTASGALTVSVALFMPGGC